MNARQVEYVKCLHVGYDTRYHAGAPLRLRQAVRPQHGRSSALLILPRTRRRQPVCCMSPDTTAQNQSTYRVRGQPQARLLKRSHPNN